MNKPTRRQSYRKEWTELLQIAGLLLAVELVDRLFDAMGGRYRYQLPYEPPKVDPPRWDAPYEVLGVAPTASVEEIRSAFRRLVKENHPDTNKGKGDTEKLKRVIWAGQRLGL